MGFVNLNMREYSHNFGNIRKVVCDWDCSQQQIAQHEHTWCLHVVVGLEVEVAKETAGPGEVASTEGHDADIVRELADVRDTMRVLEPNAVSDAQHDGVVNLEWKFTDLTINEDLW